MKLHIDLVKSGEPGEADSWKKIQGFYDVICFYSDFDVVNKAQFAEILTKPARTRLPPTPTYVAPNDNPQFFISGPPPPPIVAAEENKEE